MANEEQVALLRQGSQVWNGWREKNLGTKIDISPLNLRAVNLKAVNLRAVDLRKVNFGDAKLSEANLSDTNLSSTNLSFANLRAADLTKANLRFANLNRTDLSAADLLGTDLRGANLTDANLSDANLRGANLQGAKLEKADLSDASFRNTKLMGSNLKAADASGADFSNADFANADLRYTNFRSTDLSNANLRNADLSKADFCCANLSGVDLSNANLHNVNLSNANLDNANLNGAELRDANFSDANLNAVKVSAANLNGANFSNANLSGAELVTARVLGTHFINAILTGACIADWQIGSSTILEGVECDYIFRTIDSEGNFTERCPANRKFEPGEFTKLFQVSQDTIELILREGINWQAFAPAFSETNTKIFDASGQELYLKKYEVFGDGLVQLEVAVPPGSDKQAIHDDLVEGYKQQITRLTGNYERKIARLEGKLESKGEDYKQLLRTLKPGDTYNVYNQKNEFKDSNIGNVASVNHGNMTATIHNHYGQDADSILQKLEALREYAKSFPEEENEAIQVHLEGLGQDLQQAEKPSTARLKTRLVGLLGVALALGTHMATATDFANNVLELADKLAVPTDALQPQLQQLKAIYPEFDWPQPE